MARHQRQAELVGQRHQVEGFFHTGGQRLFHQHMLAGEERGSRQLVMGPDRGRHDHRLDVAGQELLMVCKGEHAVVTTVHVLEAGGTRVGDGDQVGFRKLREVANVLRSPVPATDDADANGRVRPGGHVARGPHSRGPLSGSSHLRRDGHRFEPREGRDWGQWVARQRSGALCPIDRRDTLCLLSVSSGFVTSVRKVLWSR